MPNRLADAISPYLRSHADNPVDWWQWGAEPFAEARRRDVPVLVSIGYSTCHWCHVMARESFSDPALAEYLNEHFVAIKVDREEHPDVDSSYLAAASAFTENLGWPLNVFVTPEGHAFFAGTYWPPLPLASHPSFRQILEAVQDAWALRRSEVESDSAAITAALAARPQPSVTDLPADFSSAVRALQESEDTQFGGFGGAPKFPVAPVLLFLQTSGSEAGREMARRSLQSLAGSALRDPVAGGFFRYATMRDWTEPHYERMLYDNAQLLDAYTLAAQRDSQPWAQNTAEGIAEFLLRVMRLPSGGFASAQDSESTIDGQRVEGTYYTVPAEQRAALQPPPLDEKVLTGWNGLAIGALARAGAAFDRPEWLRIAARAADFLLETHRTADGKLLRASVADRSSRAIATLEDYGMFAEGLFALSCAGGEVRYAVAARALVDAVLQTPGSTFAVPGGPDAVLVSHGMALPADPSEGAYPSGLSACASAAHTLYLLSGERRYLDAATVAMGEVAEQAVARPIGFGAALRVMAALAQEPVQLVVVSPDVGSASGFSTLLTEAARRQPTSLTAFITESQASVLAEAGFELFAGRSAQHGKPTAYLCREFVCRLPTTDARELLSS